MMWQSHDITIYRDDSGFILVYRYKWKSKKKWNLIRVSWGCQRLLLPSGKKEERAGGSHCIGMTKWSCSLGKISATLS